MFLPISTFAQLKLTYDLSGAGSGTEGTALVKVYVSGKKVADTDLKKAAVHGVIFRGFSGTASGASQPALSAPTNEISNKEFFNNFFENTCQSYAEILDGSYERIKTAKGYKVGAIVQVHRTQLRQDLEKAGVIKSLGNMF